MKTRTVRIDKDKLELLLSRIPRFTGNKRRLEQYETPASIAAHMVWEAFIRGDVSGRDIADLGCGTLRLGLAALLLGARRVVGIDIDPEILDSAKEVFRIDLFRKYVHQALLISGDVRDTYLSPVNTVIMNPPFGVVKGNRGLDLLFLRKALELGESVYTIHKSSRGLDGIVRNIADAYGYDIIHTEQLYFPIPMMFETHRRKIYRVRITFYILRRKQ